MHCKLKELRAQVHGLDRAVYCQIDRMATSAKVRGRDPYEKIVDQKELKRKETKRKDERKLVNHLAGEIAWLEAQGRDI